MHNIPNLHLPPDDCLEFHKSVLLKYRNTRDRIFVDVLGRFDRKPISIFELGGAAEVKRGSRFGNGWSSIFWAQYVQNNGGSLTICDINPTALSNANLMLKSFIPSPNIKVLCSDGYKRLQENNDYDLIYLDGSDNPQDMVDQFELCDLKKSYVLCDDFTSKGAILRNMSYPKVVYTLSGGHQMALFKHGIENQSIVLD